MPEQFDPLSYIPPSTAVQKRLDSILKEAAKLKILLRTAREIEQVKSHTQPKGGAV